jgi:hypothetical protein
MAILNPTPPDALLDAHHRPYFLWDVDMTVETFRERLEDPDPEVRAYFTAKLMRQAKPDDVFTFVTLDRIRTLWPMLERYLGQRRALWAWLLEQWRGDPRGSV